MLPKASKARQQAVLDAQAARAQSMLDTHTVKVEPKPERECFTNGTWAEAAWEGMISTDQVSYSTMLSGHYTHTILP